MKDVIIIGFGGQARVVADIVRRSGDRVLGFLDDNAQDPQVLGAWSDVGKWDCYYIPAIGSSALREALMKAPVRWYTAIHPSATVADNAVIGEGSVIMAGSVLSPGAVTGKGSILNTQSSLDHDSVMGDFSHISAGAHVGACNRIGSHVQVSMGATVISGISVCDRVLLGAGAVAVRDITEPGTYVGVPARRIK